MSDGLVINALMSGWSELKTHCQLWSLSKGKCSCNVLWHHVWWCHVWWRQNLHKQMPNSFSGDKQLAVHTKNLQHAQGQANKTISSVHSPQVWPLLGAACYLLVQSRCLFAEPQAALSAWYTDSRKTRHSRAEWRNDNKKEPTKKGMTVHTYAKKDAV